MTNKSWATTNNAKANIFAEQYASVFKLLNICPNKTHILTIKRFLVFALPMIFPANYTIPGEILSSKSFQLKNLLVITSYAN